MRIFLLTFVSCLPWASLALADTSNCPTNNTTPISNATIQASPAGCLQVDLQFNLTSPVWTEFANTTNSTSNPMDSNVFVTGLGVADGQGANAQGIRMSQTSGFFFDDTSSGNETATYFLKLGVADQAAFDEITSFNLTFNNFDNTSKEIPVAITLWCSGTTSESSCPGGSGVFINDTNVATSFTNTFTSPATSFGLSIEIQTNYDGHDSVSFSSLDIQFNTQSTVPEPGALSLSLFGLAAIIFASSRWRALAGSRFRDRRATRLPEPAHR